VSLPPHPFVPGSRPAPDEEPFRLERIPSPPPPVPSGWLRWGRHAVLFVLTGLSIFLTGAQQSELFDVWAGLRLTVGLLGILLAHEMGHYLACLWYGVDATLPFFIPAPYLNFLVGTFGAVIRIRSPFPHRRALFDIGIAGPLAGFAVCLPVLFLGIQELRVIPEPAETLAGASLGEPLLFHWATVWLRGEPPPGMTYLLGPWGMAAWFGLLVTALNLIPIGQLDGGHVTYALFGSRATVLSRLAWWGCVLLVLFVGPSWVLWSILLLFLGMRHPPTLDDAAPLGRGRVGVALLGLAVFGVSFLPNPFLISWSSTWESLSQLFGR
jgi:membrane-associated protease RseP (regulator of RpoE activity)